jgi:hypothetical protein
MDIFFFRFDRFWPLILIGIGAWLFVKRWGLAGQHTTGCSCDRCRARGLMGPAILVTLGILFLLDDAVSFGRTWPALLIVIGLIKVYQSNASTEGHVELPPPAGSADVAPPPPPPSEVVNG